MLFVSLGVEITDFGLFKGVQDRKPVVLPIKVSLRVTRKE